MTPINRPESKERVGRRIYFFVTGIDPIRPEAGRRDYHAFRVYPGEGEDKAQARAQERAEAMALAGREPEIERREVQAYGLRAFGRSNL